MAGTQKKMRTKSIGKDEALTGLFCNPGDIVTRCCGRSPMEMMESVNPPRAMLQRHLSGVLANERPDQQGAEL
eukprot:CAMPEP_0203847902 /NCGR_PEP_ID=MMETSP0359-20131031/5282_1 /ASSEMBLY_ACC=CAM_ASM_000338 /TAXON_ID=268821 /ORGANISM="Scrippsiella Hangoei, Strain SHTV-5" /LENGTH=72 /DNA_ID=CAMNT_0050763423 /DNA_START=71 /DNA_END=290 /DNA_ORIENTATION=-